MSKQNENQMLEELSAIIDALNRGERMPSAATENQELAEIAGLLRKSAPPPAVIDKLSATLAREIKDGQKRKKVWFLSGAAGTVAAALLVFALSFSTQPPIESQVPLPIPPAGSIVIQSIPEQSQPRAVEEKPPQANVSQSQEFAKAPSQATDAPQQATVTKESAAEMKAKQATDERETPKIAALARKVETKDETVDTRVAMLVIPGKKPDSVVNDKEAGTVRSIYDMGKDDEITVTQHPQNRVGTAQAEQQNGFVAMKTRDEKTRTNRVTLTVAGVEITVEGKRTKEELTAIARSLVEE